MTTTIAHSTNGLSPTLSPTQLFVREMTEAFNFFNAQLFNNELPHVMITLQRKRNAKGYYCPDMFEAKSDNTSTVDEIAMNPECFDREDKSIYSTLVHEMCHLWQQKFGKPGRNNYHNKEFADKMESVGLITSQTGQPGGARIGRGMTHYIKPGGPFDQLFDDAKFGVTWKDRVCVASTTGSQGASPDKKRNKAKFSCPSCEANAWGKESLSLVCGDCETPMELED